MYKIVVITALMGALPVQTFCNDQIIPVTICQVVASPSKYDQKMVEFRGIMVQGFEWALIKENGCAVHFEYPDGPADLGPDAMYQPYGERPIKVNFKVHRDAEYKNLVKYAKVPMPMSTGCICISCHRYEVTGTFTGLVQVAKSKGPGFGHMNAARVRFIIRSVSNVVAVDKLLKEEELTCGQPRPPHLSMPVGILPALDGLVSSSPPPPESPEKK